MFTNHDGPNNDDRAEWADEALGVFCARTGLDLEVEPDDAVSDLICNVGHFCDRSGLNFVSLVSRALSVWEVEKREEANGEPGALYPQKKVLIDFQDG